jgi:hypothetical protein
MRSLIKNSTLHASAPTFVAKLSAVTGETTKYYNFCPESQELFVLLIGNGTARPTTAIYMLVIQTTSVDITVLKPIERRVANIFDSIAKRQSMRCKWERSVWRFRWWSQPVLKSKNGKEKEGKQTSSIGRLAESMMILVVESRKDHV